MSRDFMNFLKTLFLLVFIFFLCGFPSSWAMSGLSEEIGILKDSALKRTADDLTDTGNSGEESDESHRKAKKQRTQESAQQTREASYSRSHPRTFFDQFKEILALEPCPIQPITEITALQEDQGGSRKWVKFFGDPQDQATHDWHRKMPEIITALREENQKGRYFAVETNFAVARLVIVLNDGNSEVIDIPYFFLSGWPANANRDSAKRFAKALATEKLEKGLKTYKDYGIQFITMSYKEDEEKSLRPRDYDPYKDEMKAIMEKELAAEDSIPGKDRLLVHSKLMGSSDSGILAKLYFHSEQSIWMAVKDEIAKFRNNLKIKNPGDIRFWLNKKPDLIAHVFVDICSFYDMCWCCGDTLASCCHTQHLGAPVYVRASGCQAYYDQPFSMKPYYTLRDHRTEFLGYESGRAFSMPANGNDPHSYKPYVAHSVASDFQ